MVPADHRLPAQGYIVHAAKGSTDSKHPERSAKSKSLKSFYTSGLGPISLYNLPASRCCCFCYWCFVPSSFSTSHRPTGGNQNKTETICLWKRFIGFCHFIYSHTQTHTGKHTTVGSLKAEIAKVILSLTLLCLKDHNKLAITCKSCISFSKFQFIEKEQYFLCNLNCHSKQVRPICDFIIFE